MSENEKDLIAELESIDTEDLPTVDIDTVRADRLRIFEASSEETPDVAFTFEILTLTAKQQTMKTRVGKGKMYHLDTVPKIVCFANAFDQLVTFVEKAKLKTPCSIKYVDRKIPEGKDSFDTKYLFEKA